MPGEIEHLLRTVAHSFEAPAAGVRYMRTCWLPYFRGCRRVLDVGSGEGVLLELLRQAGIGAEGIEIDEEYVARARAKGLKVERAYVQEYVATRKGEFDGVFLGHIIEHLRGEEMLQLLHDCRQALRAGGIMIVLTPNFEHPNVGSRNFWLDVTHQRPYPLPLLEKIFAALGMDVTSRGFLVDSLDEYIVGRVPTPPPKVEPAARPVAYDAPPVPLIWEGGLFITHSLALINRELPLALLRTAGVDLSLAPTEEQGFDPATDARLAPLVERVGRAMPAPAVTVRHSWPPNFAAPATGHWVMIQPWEFGRLPRDWVPSMRDQVDEIWAYSQAVKQCYIDSGVSGDKVFVVPAGVDPERFRPDVTPMPLATTKRFKFLFVGGTIWRKGVDVMLDAYRRAFKRSDDVCLVIKDMGQDSFYKGQGAAETIERLQADPEAPEILYLTGTFSDAQMPGLYTACDALVHPYRGEGFAMPVAEAMACGLPPILSRGGAPDDFCDDDTVYWVPAFHRNVDVGQATAGPAWVLEPDVAALGFQLLDVYGQPDEARARGQRASDKIRRDLTWDAAAATALERLRTLASRPPRPREPAAPVTIDDAVSRDRNRAAALATFEAGRAALNAGDPATAVTRLRQAVERMPALAAAHYLLACVELQEGRPDEALPSFQRAVEIEPTRADFLNGLGAALQDVGRRDEARIWYRRALAVDPGNESAHANLLELDPAAE